MSKFQRLFKKNRNYSNPANKKTDTFRYRRFNILICLAVIFIIAAYLFQVNNMTNLGYSIRQLEEKADELQVTNDKLEIQAANLQSISKIQAQAAELGFIEVDNIKYIDNNELTIAVIR